MATVTTWLINALAYLANALWGVGVYLVFAVLLLGLGLSIYLIIRAIAKSIKRKRRLARQAERASKTKKGNRK